MNLQINKTLSTYYQKEKYKNFSFEDMQIYIAHYTKLKDRKEKLINRLNKENINNYTFYEKYDQQDITCEIDDENYIFDENSIKNDKNLSFLTEEDLQILIKSKGIGIALKSLNLKHKNIINEFLKNDKEYLLVLEDDIIFVDNFVEKLNNTIRCSTTTFDILIISAGSLSKYENYEKFLLHDDTSEIIDTGINIFALGADGYIINKNTARIFSEYYSKNKMMLPIDWELTLFSIKNNINVKQVYPYLAYQESFIKGNKSTTSEG